MIWGKTDKEKVQAKQEKRERRVHKHKEGLWFAWHGVFLTDGRRAWLSTVHRKWRDCSSGDTVWGYWKYTEIVK